MTLLPALTRDEMIKMLDEERVGRIGLNDEPQPYVVPTDFAFADDAIYIHTPENGRKARLARSDPNVCFEVDHFNRTVTDFRSVIVRGRIAEVSDWAERARAMRLLGDKAAKSGANISHGKAGGRSSRIAIFKIEIRDMTGVRSPDNGLY